MRSKPRALAGLAPPTARPTACGQTHHRSDVQPGPRGRLHGDEPELPRPPHGLGRFSWQTSAAFSAIRRCQPGGAKKQRVIAIAFRCRPEREKLSSVDAEVF